jgi:opacity protein-like surface antigen
MTHLPMFFPTRVLPLVLFLCLTPAAPVYAQAQTTPDPTPLSIRLVGTFTLERFAADTTFGAIFGESVGTLFGGGARVERGNLFVEVTASRFHKSGQRGFATDGDGFGLDIPLIVTITPIEFAVGRKLRPFGRATPYVGGGIGIYSYKETSPVAEAGEDVTARHAGWLLVGGAEFRLHRLLAVGADLHYTNVPGILGQGGLSQAVDEPNLGGIAARFKVIFGR